MSDIVETLLMQDRLLTTNAAHKIAELRSQLAAAEKLAADRLEQMTQDRKQALDWRDEVQRLRCQLQESALDALSGHGQAEEHWQEVQRLRSQVEALKRIADIAHCGGLAELTEWQALFAVRRLTVHCWDATRSRDAMTRDTNAAVQAARAAAIDAEKAGK